MRKKEMYLLLKKFSNYTSKDSWDLFQSCTSHSSSEFMWCQQQAKTKIHCGTHSSRFYSTIAKNQTSWLQSFWCTETCILSSKMILRDACNGHGQLKLICNSSFSLHSLLCCTENWVLRRFTSWWLCYSLLV